MSDPPTTDPEHPLPEPDPTLLVEIARGRMPFGRYAGRRYIELPEPYLTWFAQQGWPKGRLGEVLATTLEIRANGLEKLVHEIDRRTPRD